MSDGVKAIGALAQLAAANGNATGATGMGAVDGLASLLESTFAAAEAGSEYHRILAAEFTRLAQRLQERADQGDLWGAVDAAFLLGAYAYGAPIAPDAARGIAQTLHGSAAGKASGEARRARMPSNERIVAKYDAESGGFTERCRKAAGKLRGVSPRYVQKVVRAAGRGKPRQRRKRQT